MSGCERLGRDAGAPPCRLRTYRSADGLTLAFRDYPAPDGDALPIVCLPGLTRTARDFVPLAERLSQGGRGRRVLAFDCRGRGASDHDPDWTHYAPAVEAADILAGLAEASVARAIFVGTSRGGILTMLVAAARPGLVAGAILNDIGARIEAAGLADIRRYVGRIARPPDWAAAEAALRRLFLADFPALAESDWRLWTRMSFAEEAGRPAIDYDPALARTLEGPDAAGPIDLDPAFAALAGVPVLLLRGEYSRILSAATADLMAGRHPALELVTVPGQGHPVLLAGPIRDVIAAFCDRIDPA